MSARAAAFACALLAALVAALALTTQSLHAQVTVPKGEPPRLPADWAQRDTEGKWIVYQRDLESHASDADRSKAWAELLADRRELELLEWIGLYRGWRFAGAQLAKVDAPALFRVALWNLEAFDSHNKDNAQKALLGRGAAARAWFEKYPVAQRGRGAQLYEQLCKAWPAGGDAGAQLPPLDPVPLLVPQLDAPAQLATFGERTRAEPKVVYVHQVVRALDGLLVWGQAVDLHVPKVLALTRHADPTVRNAAFATLTRLPGELLPVEPLLATADGGGEPATRRLATLAMSYSAHPRAPFELLRIAQLPLHPGRDVAVLRLGELADPFVLAQLQAFAKASTGSDDFAAAAAKAERRLTGLEIAQVQELAPRWLERVAWLRATGHPLAGDAAPAIRRALRDRLPGDTLRDALAPLLDGPLRAQLRGDGARLQQLLRDCVREVLAK